MAVSMYRLWFGAGVDLLYCLDSNTAICVFALSTKIISQQISLSISFGIHLYLLTAVQLSLVILVHTSHSLHKM